MHRSVIEEAERLITQGKKESLEAAIGKILAAVPLYRAAANKALEAESLNSIGTLYSDLGEQQQALNYFVRSLSLYRESGDRGGHRRPEPRRLSLRAFRHARLSRQPAS